MNLVGVGVSSAEKQTTLYTFNNLVREKSYATYHTSEIFGAIGFNRQRHVSLFMDAEMIFIYKFL